MRPNRRDILRGMASGTALLTMPSFLAGCARSGEAVASVLPSAPINPFYNWFGIDDARLHRVMSELTARGADHADLYFQYTRSNSITMEDGIVSKASSSIDEGVGLRVVLGDQTGYAFTEDLSEDAMKAAARTASAIAHGGGLAAPQAYATQPAPHSLYSLAVPWTDVGIDRKLPLIQALEAKAKAKDPSITKVRIWWSDSESRVLVVNHLGHVHTDVRPQSRLWCSITATKDGVTQSNSANLAGRRGIDWFTDEQLETLAQQAADRTMILFEARRPPAGELPVVLAAGASGILLHEAIGHGMEADFNRKDVSIYADMIGKKVAPDFVTIVDSGLHEGERGALNFDDEGNPAERTVLVENGVMASYLHDNISAKHYGVKPTGSGRRQSFRHSPMPRMRCTYMEEGPHTREEIISSVKGTGIIAETFTNGQVQIGAGDFTFYIKNGWLIEDGKVTAPIKDVNIIGNGPEALKKMTMAANDARLDTGGWTCGKSGQSVPVSQGLPTVLVSSLTVGGESA
jgi:TldD protein